ncbi:citrate lyase acyl carrier protein [Aminomonas paucivorans]|uniref:Citrate lyase acyl carrier protein CitD n=1 Tax=Aminomonas paucivorans DSM 12260 TaxID=584708 RepID=E3CWF1_9BACT|nr:citrate lyase acyl carrier protein [Aminomonas paucivorans]EFQ24306.1 Citrate lyase acyl carrier protein CitD [Aminomonas paucivorans DSM 12260]
MKTAQAGTVESMDCLVTLSEGTAGSGVAVQIAGSGAARFRTAMEKKVRQVLESLQASDVSVNVQDNGALDIVLGARVEAAYRRFAGGEGR